MHDNALLSAEIITHPGPEYQSASRHWQGIPGIERARNGRLWATWYTGGITEQPGNYVVLVTSDDDGATWTEPMLVVAPPDGCRTYDPCLWHDPLGRLWLFWAQCEGFYDGRAGVWAIRCDDATSATPVFTAPRRLCHGIMMNKPTVLSTGEWCLPAAIWVYVPPVRHELDSERFSNCVVSTDGGETWHRRGGADVPERAFDEHMIVERRDGSLWMLVRTQSGIGESISTDRGITWSPGRPALPGPNSRFFLRRLRSGRLLLVNHEMAAEGNQGRSHLTAWLSEDDGASWLGGLLLDARWQVSYPDGVEADDGRIYIIYDYNRGAHYPGSANALRDREILLAVLTEEDVLAGHPVSPQARLHVRVNRIPDTQPTGAEVAATLPR